MSEINTLQKNYTLFTCLLYVIYSYHSVINVRTCGVISPKITIKSVEHTTATRPDVRPSSKIVNVELTNTLPNKMLHRRKLP